MAKEKFYAVQNGRETGVYKSWAEAQAQVSGFKGATFKKFDNVASANSFANGSGGYGGSAPVRPAYNDNSFYSNSDTSFVKISNFQSSTRSTHANRTLKPKSSSTNSYYAVANGYQTGVYNSWTECKKAVDGYERPVFKKFDNLQDADAFVDKSTVSRPLSSYTPSAAAPTVKPRTSSSKYYAVNYSDGRSDIFTTWRDCQSAVTHQRGVTFRKFDTLGEAKTFTSTTKAPKLSRAQKQQSIEEYLDRHGKHSLEKQQSLPPKRVFMDGSFMNKKAGYGIFFGDNDPRNVSAHIPDKEVDSYVAEVHATLGALKIIHDEISEFQRGERESVGKYTLATDSETAIKLLDKYTLSWKDAEFSKRKAGKQLKDAVSYFKGIKEFYAKNSAILGDHEFEIEWVKGHHGIDGNEAADQLAKQGAMGS